MVVGMQIKARIIRYLSIALHWVPFLGSWLLIRQLHKAYAEYGKSVEQLTAIKAGEMTFRETGMNVSFESWIAPHLAASAYELLDEKKADNYVELKLYRPGDGPGKWVTVLVQRCNGLTPGEKAAKATEEADQLRARVAELVKFTEEMARDYDCDEGRACRKCDAQNLMVKIGVWDSVPPTKITAPKDGDITANSNHGASQP